MLSLAVREKGRIFRAPFMGNCVVIGPLLPSDYGTQKVVEGVVPGAPLAKNVKQYVAVPSSPSLQFSG